ncbi:MAG: UvrD-helicase domain-containing protein [Chromatiales bacterium]|jgi:ATP-dependent exoDNAse (exonuclease V) beta subunit|nr:UvrD-helicase domain-containing protein [Chromatiales bacterium]
MTLGITQAQVADDSAARQRALHVGSSFIVQAPAGAGKTELLTQRYLALLSNVEAPEEILAITFTRKAAGEMHHRIISALERAANEPPPEAAHHQRTWRLARAALDVDTECGWDLLLNPARLRILTIDALCASLTRRMPVLSGFGAPAQVIEDAVPLYREAARQTLAEVESGEQWSPAIAHLLRHLDNNPAQIEDLIARMLAARDQWLSHVHGVDRKRLEHTLARVNEEALQALRASIPVGIAHQLIEPLWYALNNLAANGGDVAQALTALESGGLPNTEPEALRAWRQLAKLVLTSTGGWRARLTVKEGFPAAKGTGSEAARCRDMKERMQTLLGALAEAEDFRCHLHAVHSLPPLCYSDAQWETITAFAQLLRIAAGLLDVTFRERNVVDFARVAQAAQAALGDAEHPTDLALALDQRIRHILIDEFQDTSIGQYKLLETLTAGWEWGDGRTLFLVGDPMQSIYRFREAEVGLYLRARHEGMGSVTLEPLNLTVNYRSQAGIIDWVNSAFARVLPASEDLASGAVPYTPSRAHHPALHGAAVQMHALLESGGEEEAELVRELITAARANIKDGSTAVLVRSRGHLLHIVAKLRQAGMRFRAVEIEHLAHRPVVQDLLSLTCALTHPADRVSWLAVLRAPWCGLSLADLHALVSEDRRAMIADLLADDERLQALSADGRTRLVTVRAVLAASRAERGRRSLRTRVEGAWIALGGPACVARGDLDDAHMLFAVLDEVDEGGDLIDRALLWERIDRLYARPDVEGDDGLQIMTIHKAKGLEFDTVIVPGLGRRPRANELRLLMWMRRAQGDLLLAPIREAGAEADPIYRYISALDSEKACHEDGRLLYVAATRAKQRLHLIGAVKCREGENGLEPRQPPSQSLLARLWPAVEDEFISAARALSASVIKQGAEQGTGQNMTAPETEVLTLAANRLRRLPAGWTLPPAPPAISVASLAASPRAGELIEFAWAGETARHVGTVTHRLLQECARAGINSFARLDTERLARSARLALIGLGLPEAEVEVAGARVLAALHATLEDERGRWILDPGHADARCEYALNGMLDGRQVSIVIDRSFIDAEGVRWIIDYKTGGHEGSGVEAFLDREQMRYREQLENYAALMRARETRPIRLGLYFPLLRGWREWEA